MSEMPTYQCADCHKPISRSAKMDSERCAACTRRVTGQLAHPTWFGRWRVYPWSCAGHIAQGAVAGLLPGPGLGLALMLWMLPALDQPGWEMTPVLAMGLMVMGLVAGYIWWRGFEAYQRLSFQRKVNTTGRGDTAGLDAYDFIVGYVPASIALIAAAAAAAAAVAISKGG